MSAPTFHNPDLELEYHLVVPHPAEPRLLLLPDGAGWGLPRFAPFEHHFGVVGHVNRWTAANLGLETVVLRSLGENWQPGATKARAVYELENLSSPHTSAAPAPLGGRWADRGGLAALELASEHREKLETWFDEAEQGPPPGRRPWARRGWFAGAIAWLEARAFELGLELGPVEQARNWERSCVLRAESSGGRLYLKAVPPAFAHEGPLTRVLGERLPGRFPKVLALEPERGLMLMADLGGQPLSRVPDLERWADALRLYARTQLDLALGAPPPPSAPGLDLLALGCPDRRLETLRPRIAPFLGGLAKEPLLAGLARPEQGLTPEELERLAALAPELEAACLELAELGLPASLDHGDFWPGNVIAREGGYALFDLSDASLSHPFFGLGFFLEDLEASFPGVGHARERLVAAYLEPWATLAPPSLLERALPLALRLAPLHGALLYAETILPPMEAHWEMENMLPYCLRTLLRAAPGAA